MNNQQHLRVITKTTEETCKLPWSVVANRCAKASRGKYPINGTANKSKHQYVENQSQPSSSPDSHSRHVPIEDARKVWGTMKSATPSVIINAIKRLIANSSLGQNLRAKLKYRTSQDGSVRKWWFVVRSDVSSIKMLEQEWPRFATQTGWKLESVFRYDDNMLEPAVYNHQQQTPAATAVAPTSEHTTAQQPPVFVHTIAPTMGTPTLDTPTMDTNTTNTSSGANILTPCSPLSVIQSPINSHLF